MSNEREMLAKFGQAADYLPPRLRAEVQRLSGDEKLLLEEFRLRSGRCMSMVSYGKEIELGTGTVRHEELQSVLERATGSSVHSSRASIREGFVTVRGGHRIGLCGTAIRDRDGVSSLRELSSVSIRIAKEIRTSAEGIPEKIIKNDKIINTLIISPPGYGKTTVLRDLVRRISDMGKRVSLVDERGELAAKHRGQAQFDVGRCTDIIDGIDKATGAMLVLRSMNPQVIALDEITAKEDIKAISEISNCGVNILATAHASCVDDLFSRTLYKELHELCVFERAITLKKGDEGFSYSVSEL